MILIDNTISKYEYTRLKIIFTFKTHAKFFHNVLIQLTQIQTIVVWNESVNIHSNWTINLHPHPKSIDHSKARVRLINQTNRQIAKAYHVINPYHAYFKYQLSCRWKIVYVKTWENHSITEIGNFDVAPVYFMKVDQKNTKMMKVSSAAGHQ